MSINQERNGFYSSYRMPEPVRQSLFSRFMDWLIPPDLPLTLLHEAIMPAQHFQDLITQWAKDRNLVEGSTPDAQLHKLAEEVEELCTAIANRDIAETIDAIGDIQVVLGVICAQLGLDVDTCRDSAWNEIKDRKGKMVDGIFVKEA